MSWFLIASSAIMYKKFPRKDFAFVFLFVDFLNTNLYYLFGDAFHFFMISDDPMLYVSLALLQSIIIPLTIAIMINVSVQNQVMSRKAAVQLAAIGALVCLELMSHLLLLITYHGFLTAIWLFLYRLVLFYMAYLALKCFKRMCSYGLY
ncbi:hypothetical protein ICC18_01935 [Paenibacillus sp. WST5]|uniref:Uncharacterized protein n=1 Tax=Paenibacillus sedimenti TaxID=2770274 RepID=A0A926QGW9_9BACL|nr:hypothetical protein [Paenibacillus sedimenti]